MARFLLAAVSALVVLAGANAQLNADNENYTINYVSARQGYSAEDESTVNSIINTGFTDFYQYTAIMAYFKQDNQDLHGFAKFFLRLAMEKKECALKFIKYQSRRGGVVQLGAIPAQTISFANGLDAFTQALTQEKSNYDALNSAYGVAVKNSDPELAFEIQKDVHHSSEKIKEIASIVRDLQRADAKKNKWGGDNSFGEYHVDHDLEHKEKEHEMHEMEKKCKHHHGKHHGGGHHEKKEW
jgi:ferritin